MAIVNTKAPLALHLAGVLTLGAHASVHAGQPEALSARRLPAEAAVVHALHEPLPDLPLAGHDDASLHPRLAANDSLELPVLSTLFQPTWDDLDDSHQRILAPFAPEWNTWPVAERRSWVAFADRIERLPQAQQQRARKRVLEWANMSPEERRIARINYQNSKRHSQPDRKREWENYRSLTWSEREALRRAAEKEAADRRTGLARQPAQPIHAQSAPEPAAEAGGTRDFRVIIRQTWRALTGGRIVESTTTTTLAPASNPAITGSGSAISSSGHDAGNSMPRDRAAAGSRDDAPVRAGGSAQGQGATPGLDASGGSGHGGNSGHGAPGRPGGESPGSGHAGHGAGPGGGHGGSGGGSLGGGR